MSDQARQGRRNTNRWEDRFASPLNRALPGRHDRSRSRIGVLLGVLVLGLGLIWAVIFFAAAHQTIAYGDPAAKIEPNLQAALDHAKGDEPLRVIILMQATAQDIYDQLPQEKLARREVVVERLQQAANRSQADIKRTLQQYEFEGGVSYYRSLWIINALQVVANKEAVVSLAASPDVARVALDASLQLLDPMTPTLDSQVSALPWHLERTGVQHVWAGLGISGTGATVAVMDTGADWQHPALANSYAGLANGGVPDHEKTWFDAVDGLPEPFDPHGHGTHVIGTASGGLGIGVAPGSQWMAVRVLRPDGSGLEGDIHAGFQWLLAPGGDPALAPDIVNGSWSAGPSFDGFMPDIAALKAAGIAPVFSAGNSGPDAGSVRAPANYPGVIAVGATDDADLVAWYSSRGPSPWTLEIKPTIVAPGTEILSALPDGNYGYLSGTSMASPHVAGIIALLQSAEPTLDVATAITVMTSTARLGSVESANDAIGWGRADAYAAVASLLPTGRLLGTVSGDGIPLPGGAVTITTPSAVELPYSVSSDGSYAAQLISGTYGIEVTAYGYAPYSDPAVMVISGTDTVNDVNLVRLPYGIVKGQLFDATSGQPLSGTIRISGTPVTSTVVEDGRYAIELPEGEYELVAWVSGHLLERQEAMIMAGATTELDIWLEPGPKVLLVDSGKWYGDSHKESYTAALQENDFSYDVRVIRNPTNDGPTIEMLSQYDVVVWSSPRDTPGTVGSAEALASFLDEGGKALISGPNVAEIEDEQPSTSSWWYDQLRGLYLGNADPPFALQGEPGTVFEGVQLALPETDAGGRPVKPDASAPARDSLAQVGFRYADGRAASLLGGQCESFRLAYFGFGLEHVDGSEARADLMASTFEFFAQPETEVGLKLDRESIQDLVPPGSQRTYPIQLLNLSELYTDTFHLTLSGADWPARIVTDTLELGPCQAAPTAIEIEIPPDLALNSKEQFELKARSSIEPAYHQTVTFDLKSPGRMLLVDDDRWYDQSATFKAALDGAGIAYDFWENNTNTAAPGSPPADLLNAYDFVFWYTGYDWFRPVTKSESETLEGYLNQGGRLFLTSQDYLYYHLDDPLTRDYLGVRQYAESVTPTIAYGTADHGPFGDIGGPHALNFGPYQNNGDGVIPGPDAQVSLWHDAGYPAGLASSRDDWRTVFWAIPLETLPEEVHTLAMDRILGWLSDLGESSFAVDDRGGPDSAPRTYTLTLRYAPSGQETWVTVTNTLPISLALDPSTLSGSAQFDETSGQVTWSGYLQPGQEHQIAYTAAPDGELKPGDLIDNPIEIYYDGHDISFGLTERTWIGTPDLSPSKVSLRPMVVQIGHEITVEMSLVNVGSAGGHITSGLRFPSLLAAMTRTLALSGGTVDWSDQQLSWSGWLEPGQIVTASVVVTVGLSTTREWLPVTAIIEDGLTEPVIVSSLLEVRPHARYLPLVRLNKP